MDQLFPALGPYFWWIVAAVLLIAEMSQPGFFMIWLAAAAGLTAIVHLVAPMAWESEILVFAVFAVVAIAASWRIVTKSWQAKSDQPHLNQRHEGLVGHTYYLERAIVNGTGKIRVNDTMWDVVGDDMPKGEMVKVTGLDGLRLKVKAI